MRVYVWLKGIGRRVYDGYNNFVYKKSVPDTTGPTIVFGMGGR